MKKIIVNGRFLLHRTTGVERYAREILNELDRIVAPGELEMAVPPGTVEIPDYVNIKIIRVGRFNNRAWEHISFPLYVKKKKGISLNLCNVAPLVAPGIVCIHDTKIKAVPQFYSRIFLVWYNLLFLNEVRRAKVIITVSDFSKSEIIKFFHISPDKIEVVPNAWQHFARIQYDKSALEKYSLCKDNYYFVLGSVEPNKNFRWVAEVAKRNPDQIFAVSGSVNEKVFSDGLGFKCPSNMRFLGYVSDEEAKMLMRDCKAFLFPTIYEGFGLPPLEALCAGARRIVVSDTEVMHEIFGDAVEYIDPFSYEYRLEIKGEKIIDENILDKYSWKKSAERLYGILKNV